MRELEREELEQVTGGNSFLEGIPNPFSAIGVIQGAIQGDAPGPAGMDAYTATATGPTPGNVGGRYRESDLHKPSSIQNVGGGEFGRQRAGSLFERIRRQRKPTWSSY